MLMTATAYTDRLQASTTPEEVNNLGTRLVLALKKKSPEMYIALFPTIEELSGIMTANASIYGENIQEAREDFASAYVNDVLPAGKSTFENVISDGLTKGIEWETIEFQRAEANAEHGTSLTIFFSAGGKEYSVTVTRTLEINGKLRATQYIELH